MANDPGHGHFLTPEDRETLDRLIAAESRRFRSVRKSGEAAADVDDQEFLAPEVFVARTPAGGIPALGEGYTSWTGTGTLTHVGTGTELLEDDAPGYADCAVWRVLGEGVGETPVLSPLDAPYYRVYNMSTSAVAGNTWVLVMRDKPGAWWVVQGGGGGLDVCGNPTELAQPTGTSCACPEREPVEVLYPDVTALKFYWKNFRTIEHLTGDCGRAEEDGGTGTGTGVDVPLGKTIEVRTEGFTGEISVGKGDAVICDDCSIVETVVIFCYEDGLLLDTCEIEQECPP